MPWVCKVELVKYIVSTIANELNPNKLESLIATYPKREVQDDEDSMVFGLYDNYEPEYEYWIEVDMYE